MAMRTGVSLYSYQQAYYKGELDLEGCVREAAKAGAEGIELIAEQMPAGRYPDPSSRDIQQWKALMEQYNTTPTCMDSFIDFYAYKNRMSTVAEQVQMMEQDLKLASQLGFYCIRVLCVNRPEVIEKCIPMAEYYGVSMGLEIHPPLVINGRWVTEYLEMIEKYNTKAASLIPDFGIFAKGLNSAQIRLAKINGARDEIVNRITEAGMDKEKLAFIKKELQDKDGNASEINLAGRALLTTYNNPELLRGIAKHLVHFHAKFYDMDENCNETSIDYENPIRILKELGYNGYLSSEYEGQRMFHFQGCPYEADEIEQVRRHQIMMKRLIDAE